MRDGNKHMTAVKLSESMRKRAKKQRDAICSATADWAQWSSAWRECWSTGRGRRRKEEGMDGWREVGGQINEVEMRGNSSCATAGLPSSQPAWP